VASDGVSFAFSRSNTAGAAAGSLARTSCRYVTRTRRERARYASVPIGTSTSAASNSASGNPADAAPDACTAHALIPPLMPSVAKSCSRQYPSQTHGNQRTRKNATTTSPNGNTRPASAGSDRAAPPPVSPDISTMAIASTTTSTGSVFSHSSVTSQPRTP